MRFHLLQCDTIWEDKEANFKHARDLAKAAGIAPGGVIVLPEMFDTGFSFHVARTADSDGQTLAFLREFAKETGCVVHGARTVMTPGGRGLNRATVVAPDGQLLCEYDKVHPFSIGRESEFFDGGTVVRAYSVGQGADAMTVCPVICYDLRFPELFRRGVELGAEVFVVTANWPSVRQMHRHVLSRARAIENQAVVLCLNRTGRDPTLVYDGHSIAFDAKGEPLGELGGEPGVLTVDVDLGAIRKWRADFPALRDARAAVYRGW